MKIAICLFKYFPYGGMQRDFFRIAMRLAKKHTVDVFTTAWQGQVPEGITVHIVRSRGWTNHQRMQNFSKKALEDAKRSGCAFIVGFNKMPGLDIYVAADNCYVKQVQKNHSVFYRLTPRYRRYASLEKSVFSRKNMTKILILAEKQRKEYQEIYQTTDERFYLLPAEFSEWNINLANKAAIRRTYDIDAGEYLVLMVCSAFKTKGVDRSLRALAKLPLSLQKKIHLLVMGQDNALPFLRLARSLNLQVKVQFLGGRKDVLDYMCAADLFLHPARKEAAGKVLIEAIGCGAPIITTFECGYAEHVVKANAGVVLPEKCTDEMLANAVENVLLATDEVKAAWRRQGLAYAANYPSADLAETAEKIIETLEGEVN